MRKRPEITELPTRLLAVELGSQKRWKKIALFGGFGAVVVGAGVYGAVRAMDSKSSAALDEGWSRLNTCFLGEPLAQGEKASARVRQIQLGIVGVPREKRAKASELAWPSSCAPHAAAFGDSAKSSSRGSEALAAAAHALAKSMREDANGTADLTELADKLFSDPAASKLKAGAAAGVTPAPRPATPSFSREAFFALPRFLSGGVGLSSLREESGATDKLRFVVDQKDLPEGPVVCTVSGVETMIRCQKLPATVAKLSPGLRLIGTTDAQARPFYFAGDRGQLGIFPPEGGDPVVAAVALGATARSDGSLSLLSRKDERDVYLVHRPAGRPGTERLVVGSADIDTQNDVGLFWQWLAHRSGSKAKLPSRLMVRTVSTTGDVAPAVDVGEIPVRAPTEGADKESHLSACRSGDDVALRIRGADADAVAFYAGGRWAAPVKTATRGGALTCRGVEAMTTQVAHEADGGQSFATVTQSRCSVSGCTTSTVAMKSLLVGLSEIAPADANGFAAADVGGKLLVVWNGGMLGGLRMRLAPADKIKDAEDTVIFDGRGQDEALKLSSVVELRAFTAGDHALLFVGTTAGVRVLRIDSAGKITPMESTL